MIRPIEPVVMKKNEEVRKEEASDEENSRRINDVTIIPPKKIFNINLKHLPAYRSLRKEAKNANMQFDFIEQFKEVLAIYDVEGHKYDNELLLCIMIDTENHYKHMKKSGEYKAGAVIEIMKRFYDNNEVLVKNQIKMLMRDLPQSFIRRHIYSIATFFLNLRDVI
jgi:hypothetical protein